MLNHKHDFFQFQVHLKKKFVNVKLRFDRVRGIWIRALTYDKVIVGESVFGMKAEFSESLN